MSGLADYMAEYGARLGVALNPSALGSMEATKPGTVSALSPPQQPQNSGSEIDKIAAQQHQAAWSAANAPDKENGGGMMEAGGGGSALGSLGGMMGGKDGGSGGSGDFLSRVPGMISEEGAMGGGKSSSGDFGAMMGGGDAETGGTGMGGGGGWGAVIGAAASSAGGQGGQEAPKAPPKPRSEEEGLSFREAFKSLPEKERADYIARTAAVLKQSGQSIDSAYDDLVKQLGARPEEGGKLTRQEKGMLVMEFGLNLIANSQGDAYGTDLGGAAAASVGPTAQRWVDMRGQKHKDAQQYDRSVGAINAERAKDKAGLAKTAFEKAAGEKPPTVSGQVTAKNGKLYMYRNDGSVIPMRDSETNEPLTEDAQDRMSGPKFESEYKFNQYMSVHGVGADGKPLKGEALQAAREEALDFASRVGRQQTDEDADRAAESSADSFINANNDLFRDMTPDEVNAYRNKIADERRARMKARKKPRRSALEDGGQEETSGLQSFATEAEARAAQARNEIRVGDFIMIGGRRVKVEPDAPNARTGVR